MLEESDFRDLQLNSMEEMFKSMNEGGERMRGLLIYSFVFITCLFLVACQSIDDEKGETDETDSSEARNKQVNSEGEENTMNQVDIFDFKHIQHAPEVTENTVERYSGKGTDKEKLTPENFDDFAQELYQFQQDKVTEVNEEQ